MCVDRCVLALLFLFLFLSQHSKSFVHFHRSHFLFKLIISFLRCDFLVAMETAMSNCQHWQFCCVSRRKYADASFYFCVDLWLHDVLEDENQFDSNQLVSLFDTLWLRSNLKYDLSFCVFTSVSSQHDCLLAVRVLDIKTQWHLRKINNTHFKMTKQKCWMFFHLEDNKMKM